MYPLTNFQVHSIILGMEPIFIKDYTSEDLYEVLRTEVPWVNRDSPRDECFMAAPGAPSVYSYGNDNNNRRAIHTYNAVEMHPKVMELMEKLNSGGITQYNVCVLNYYKDKEQHLGWHADNSPEQDLQHPIAVIAFGAERYIWTKHMTQKGVIPDSQKYLMTMGSLFIMPGGYQHEYVHRIPKHDKECGGRISLTFRKLVR